VAGNWTLGWKNGTGQTVYRIRWSAKGRRTDYFADAQTGHILGIAPE
jgi:uncharacterized membrane protein YkoI